MKLPLPFPSVPGLPRGLPQLPCCGHPPGRHTGPHLMALPAAVFFTLGISGNGLLPQIAALLSQTGRPGAGLREAGLRPAGSALGAGRSLQYGSR